MAARTSPFSKADNKATISMPSFFRNGSRSEPAGQQSGDSNGQRPGPGFHGVLLDRWVVVECFWLTPIQAQRILAMGRTHGARVSINGSTRYLLDRRPTCRFLCHLLLPEALPRRPETSREKISDSGKHRREYSRPIKPRGIAKEPVGNAPGFERRQRRQHGPVTTFGQACRPPRTVARIPREWPPRDSAEPD